LERKREKTSWGKTQEERKRRKKWHEKRMTGGGNRWSRKTGKRGFQARGGDKEKNGAGKNTVTSVRKKGKPEATLKRKKETYPRNRAVKWKSAHTAQSGGRTQGTRGSFVATGEERGVRDHRNFGTESKEEKGKNLCGQNKVFGWRKKVKDRR